MGITVRGFAASSLAHSQQTTLGDDEVVLIGINDSLGAGRRAMGLLHQGGGSIRLDWH